MKIKLDVGELGQSRWYEYLLRFVFGGTITVVAGVVAKRYGPGLGGLFLAFPAIFPAAATLIEKHEEKKEGHSGKCATRAIEAAGLDAIGSGFGAVGLIAFAIVAWRLMPTYKVDVVLAAATLAWAITSVVVWEAWELLRKHARSRRRVLHRAIPALETREGNRRMR